MVVLLESQLETLAISGEFVELVAGLPQAQVFQVLAKAWEKAQTSRRDRFMLQDFRCAFSMQPPAPGTPAAPTPMVAGEPSSSRGMQGPSAGHPGTAQEQQSAPSSPSADRAGLVGAPDYRPPLTDASSAARDVSGSAGNPSRGEGVARPVVAGGSAVDDEPGPEALRAQPRSREARRLAAEFASGRAVRGDGVDGSDSSQEDGGGRATDITAVQRQFDSHRSTVVNDLDGLGDPVSPPAPGPIPRARRAAVSPSPAWSQEDDTEGGVDREALAGEDGGADLAEPAAEAAADRPPGSHRPVTGGEAEEPAAGFHEGSEWADEGGRWSPPARRGTVMELRRRGGGAASPASAPEGWPPARVGEGAEEARESAGLKAALAEAVDAAAASRAHAAELARELHGLRQAARGRGADPAPRPGSGWALWQVVVVAVCCVLAGAVLQAVLVGDVQL